MYHIKISALLANKEFEADEFRERKKPIVVLFCCVIEVEILIKSFLKNNEV